MAEPETEREPTPSEYTERYHHCLEIKKLLAERLVILGELVKDKSNLVEIYRERANTFHDHSLDDQARLLRYSCYVQEVLGKDVTVDIVDDWWLGQGLSLVSKSSKSFGS